MVLHGSSRGGVMTNFTLHRSAGLLASVLMLVGALVTTSVAAAEKVLRIANLGEPETLDPHKTSTTVEFNVLCNLFEGLVVQDPKGNVAPGVAQTWSTSADGLTYTFNLRADAKWSNGEAVTPGGFVFSFRRTPEPRINSPYSHALYPIQNTPE